MRRIVKHGHRVIRGAGAEKAVDGALVYSEATAVDGDLSRELRMDGAKLRIDPLDVEPHAL